MPELQELLTSESVHALYDGFNKGLLALDKVRENESAAPFIHQADVVSIGDPVVRWVHHRMFTTANFRPTESPNPKFPWRATLNVQDILREQPLPWDGKVEVKDSYSPENRLTSAIIRLMVGNGLAVRLPKKPGASRVGSRGFLWLREWPPGVALGWVPYEKDRTKPDHREEKRIEEFGNGPIVKRVDLRNFAPPKGDPDSVLSWAKNFTKAAFAVQHDLDEARRKIAELESKVSELESIPVASAWEGAAAEIADLLKSGGTDQTG